MFKSWIYLMLGASLVAFCLGIAARRYSLPFSPSVSRSTVQVNWHKSWPGFQL